MRNFKQLLGGAICVALAATATAPAGAAGRRPAAVVTLLGTAAGPGGFADRAGIASLVSVNDKVYLVDAGEAVSHQLARARVDGRKVHTVFLTHLHDDHTAGLPGLMSFFYTMGGSAMELVGPRPTKALLDGVLAYLGPNAEIRRQENGLPKAPSAVFSAREVAPGVVYSDAEVTVTAVENSHYALTARAFGETQKSYAYRFQTPTGSVVFTGDTGPSAAVERLAQGADVLVAEMVSASHPPPVPPQMAAHMRDEHLSPTEVGRLAARAHVRTLVLSHVQVVSKADLAEVRRQFSGRVISGQDLMTVPLKAE